MRKGEKLSFWASLKSVGKTSAVIFRLDWKNIPAFVGNQLLKTIQPFVVLFFSARILDALASGAGRETVIRWIIASLACNYGIYLLERLTACMDSVEGIALYWQLYQEMSRTLMRADYKEVEGAAIRQAKERIERSTGLFWYGPWEVPGVWMRLMEGLVTTVSALLLAWPVFLPVKGEGIPWGSAGMAALIGASLWYAVSSEGRLYRMKEDSLDGLAAEHRRWGYYKSYSEEGKGAKEIRLYRQAETVKRRCDQAGEMIQSVTDRQAKLQARSFGIRGAMAQAVGCLAYLVVGARALAGIFGVGSVVQYVGAITKLSDGIRMLVYGVQHLMMQGPHCQEYLDFIGEGKDPRAYCHEENGSEPVEPSGQGGYRIRFDHVSFRYPGTDAWALRDLTLELRQGEHLAIVGMNGSGKTTMIKLLCRLYDPEEGRILLNGRDIREYQREDYRRLFAVVFQDFQLLALPLGENLAAGTKYDEARAYDCLDRAGIGDWARGLPKKLEQPLYLVDKEGVNVSGGEAQKIAIARALYRDAPFVVLDEPTAALDPLAEAEIYSGFRDMTDKKGAIYISHRLSSCRFCDTIAVFDGGELVQLGSHEELLALAGGKYQELWNAQAKYYN